MLSNEEKLATRGRLRLWSQALDECQRIMKIIRRNRIEIQSERPVQRKATWVQDFQEYLNSLPDHTPGVATDEQHQFFSELHPPEYPDFGDCHHIEEYCRMLAVVLFCQILNNGNGAEGRVAGNTPSFRATHLEQILSSVFTTDDERNKFNALCEACLDARNRMIGHADGEAFNLTHGDPVSTMLGISSSVRSIDFGFMEQILQPLNYAVLDHAYRIMT
jgi:hypothetical protein